MKKNKKGATLAMACQAMVVIFLMFMIMSTLVVSSTISITRKSNYLAYKSFASQLGYDVESMTVDELATKYVNDGFNLTTNTNTKVELTNSSNLYVISISMVSKNPVDEDALKIEFKVNNGAKIVFVGDYVYDEYIEKYNLTSWKYQI